MFTTIQSDQLTICTYTEFAPFAHLSDAGEIIGSDITLLRCFATAYGLEATFLQRPFSGLWYRPGAGECDIAAAGMAALFGRDLGSNGLWTIPYQVVQRSLLIRQTDAPYLQKPTDFAGKTIVVTPDSSADFDAQERYAPAGAIIVRTVPSQAEIVRQLLAHEIDAFAEGDVSNAYLAEQALALDGTPLLVLADQHPMAMVEELRFAARATDPRLCAQLNHFIRSTQDQSSPSIG